MKQTDKCRICGQSKVSSIHNNKTFNYEHEFKSHSHKPNISCGVDVRAQEEERQESGYVGCKIKYSSVPYTPLTKDNWYYHDRDDYKAKVVELNKVLSALNGLREDLNCLGYQDENNIECISKKRVLRLLNEWFPILSDEVKKE